MNLKISKLKSLIACQSELKQKMYLKSRIKRLRSQMKTNYPSVFNKAEVRKEFDI